jgi:hypothetical protein
LILKSSAIYVSLAALGAMLTAVSPAFAQSGQNQDGAPTERVYPAPTNLQVLPKNLTGAQVRQIMHQWEAALGAECETCHVRDPKNIGPKGRAQFNYADDAKPEKATARLMFKMVDDINTNYISKFENSGIPVSCGTCHRGRIAPEPFSAEEGHPSAPPK